MTSVVSAPTLGDQLVEVGHRFATSQFQLVTVAAAFEASSEWRRDFSRTAAHWIARQLDVTVSTAREWIRVGRALQALDLLNRAFEDRRLSYSKVRTLTRIAEPETEAELIAIASSVPAGELGTALAKWSERNESPEKREERLHGQRRLTSSVQPDGMKTSFLALTPSAAAGFYAVIDKVVALGLARDASADASDSFPSLAQQRADALVWLVTNGGASLTTEVLFHVRGDGCTLDDGTPISSHALASLLPDSFIRALIHDARGRPINASNRRRHPSTRQKRVVKARDLKCVDCGTTDLLQFDHVPDYEETKHTVTDELELRCAQCHRRRHQRDSA